MADWPAKKNAAFNVHFPIYDADGDLVTGAASLDSEVSIDHGTFADATNEATEIATSSGVYYLTLTADEMNGDVITTITKTSTSGAKTAVNVMYTVTRQLVDLAFPVTSGRGLDVTATGAAGIDWANVENPTTTVGLSGTTVKTATDVETDTADIQSRIPAALVSGRIDASVGAMANGVVTAAAVATGAIDADAIADGAIDAGAIADGAIDAATFAAGAIDAAAIADNAIDAGAIAADAITAAKIADGAIDAATFATGAITAGAIAADAIGASELAADAVLEIVDALLSRDIDNVEGTAAIHSLCSAILKAVSKVEDDAGTLKTYRTNGSTVHMAQTVATDAALDPVDSLTVAVAP